MCGFLLTYGLDVDEDDGTEQAEMTALWNG